MLENTDVILFWDIIPHINLAIIANRAHMSEVSNIKINISHLALVRSCCMPYLPLMHQADDPCLTLAQVVSWVSQSDLSCWMPYDMLFVKLLGSVCSCSPPLPSLTVSPLWIWRPRFVLPASLEPVLVQTELTHTSANSGGASVDLPAHC